MKLINLTPHRIRLTDHSGHNINIPASGTIARVVPPSWARETRISEIEIDKPTAGTVSVKEHRPPGDGQIDGLPEPQDGVGYIVSMACLDVAAREGRSDVFAPDTGPDSVRDDSGQVIGVRRLIRACFPSTRGNE